MQEWKCCVCKEQFKRYSSQVRNKERPTCSVKCYGKRQSIDNIGEHNANYRNGNWTKHSQCECGALKDARAKRCAKCARTSKPRTKIGRRNNDNLRKTILRGGLMPYKCAICKRGPEWMNQPLTLQLDHINGDCEDDKLENLRFLCPNCHTQTPTWGHRNAKQQGK